jgi:hypothetical protein
LSELRGPTWAFGHFEGVYLNAWWDTPTPEQLTKLGAHRRAFVAARTGRLAALTIVKVARLRPMSPEAKKLSEELNREDQHRFSAQAVVLAGSGLVIAAARLLISAMQLANKTPYPTRYFSNEAEAIAWLAPLAAVSAEELKAAAQLLRAETPG